MMSVKTYMIEIILCSINVHAYHVSDFYDLQIKKANCYNDTTVFVLLSSP